MERYVIHVTKICNMKCSYCYETDKSSTYTWDEIKKLIDDICIYNDEFSVEFLGGEPMLAWDLIKKSIEYLESKNHIKVSEYIITTNGTIVNDELIEMMKIYNITYAVSLDGGYFANQLRLTKDNKNSYDIAMSNISKLQDAGLIEKINIHMVAHPYNVGLIAKSIDLFYYNGIHSIGIGIIESTVGFGKEFHDEWIDQLKFISDKIHEGEYKGLYIDELNYLKPKTDKRNYVIDEFGKVIAESYGRSDDDITKKNIYNVNESTPGILSDYIYNMRETVYKYHQR